MLPAAREACEPGVKTIELDRIADRLIRDGGATPGFLGYHGFPRSICVSINDEAVHGIPGNRKVAAGDLVSLDLGLVLEGFWADVGITVGVGKITPEAERLLKVTEEALYVGIDKAQPGRLAGRHLVGDPEARRGSRLLGHPPVRRPRDRPPDARGPPGAQLRHSRAPRRGSRPG